MTMRNDIRETALYREAEAFYRNAQQPGSGQISDAAEIRVCPDGRYAAFSGTLVDKLEGTPPTRICKVDLASGDTRVLTFGPNTDRLPKYSPDGGHVAFLSDRAKKDDFQLYLLDPSSGAVQTTPRVEGWIEYLHWSPDGKRILLAAAGHGADISSGQGAVTSKQATADMPSWMPDVETGDESFRWRRAWVYELAANTMRRVHAPQLNIWEAVWYGNDAIAAVVSPGPGEGLWYTARLHRIDIHTGESREIYKPADQLGWPAASPSGQHLAVVEAICSDRWIVAGDLKLIDAESGMVQCIDTRGVDITYTEWRSDRHLLAAGHRGFETVVGLYDLARGSFTEEWVSRDVTSGGRYVTVSGFNESGDCALVGESFARAPEIALVRGGKYRTVRSFDVGSAEMAKAIAGAEAVTWKASDGLEIQGWLLKPTGKAPFPLIVNVHGGPIWHWRPMWLGRYAAVLLMLLKRGFAVLFPNPRGSAGRGQAFARRVFGDMGGAETTDHLSGIDHLVAQGVVDAQRLGIMGGSHGGFMTSWIIGQDSRFAAAVVVAPVTNWVSEHLISNLPYFCSIALGDRYTNADGMYFERSPIMHAQKVKTPTLNICGALDRSTPPSEAMQFHNALLENGVKSVLVMYPEEGHGVRKFPAIIDYTARAVGWFDEHISRGMTR